MATYTDRVVKSVTHYAPGPLPLNQEDLGVYLINELKRLSDIIFNQARFRLERTNVLPTKPRLGDIRYFDGSNANPTGGGEGIYFYNSSGNWVKL